MDHCGTSVKELSMDEKYRTSDGAKLTPFDSNSLFGVNQEVFNNRTLVSPDDISCKFSFNKNENNEYFKQLTEEISVGRQEAIKEAAKIFAEENAKIKLQNHNIFDSIIYSLSCLCGNIKYNSSSDEDTINDYIRDILGKDLTVRDQTRQGQSEASSHKETVRAGELDIQIRDNNIPVALYEALKVSSVAKNNIYKHIKKGTVLYNPQGVKEVYIVAYVANHKNDFGTFWNRFSVVIKEYSDENFNFLWDNDELDTGMSALRVIHGVFDMDGVDHNVYVIAVKIQD